MLFQRNQLLHLHMELSAYSLLNTLSYFNVSENFAFDMHNILEGVGQYEMKLLFDYMV